MSVSLDASANRGVAAHYDAAPTQSDLPDTVAAAAVQPSAPEPSWNPQLSRIISSALAANSPSGPANTQGPSFDAQVRGQQPKAIDQQLAKLSQDVYDLPDPAATQPRSIDGWTRLDDAQLQAAGIDPATLDDPSTGFRAAVYQNDAGDHVVAFAGTDPLSGKDWLANGSQAAGLPTAQFEQAVSLATEAKAAFGDSLVITGHSLGGGLASVASVATDSAAVTFNASGVNNQTLKQFVPEADPASLKQQADDGLVRRYAVEGDILTGEQERGVGRGFAPDAIGHKISLDDPHPLPWVLEAPGLNLLADTGQGIRNHLMGSVLDALAKDHPWAPSPGGGESVTDKIADGIGKAGDVVVSGIDAVKNGGKDVVGAVTGTLGDLASHVPVIGGFLQGAFDVAGTVGKGVLEIGGNLLDGAVGIGAHLLQGADQFIGGAVGTVVDAAKTVGGWVVDGAKAVGNAAVDAAKAVGNAAVAGANAVVDGAKAVGGLVVDGAKAVGNAAVDGAKAVGNTFVNGAKAINSVMPWNW